MIWHLKSWKTSCKNPLIDPWAFSTCVTRFVPCTGSEVQQWLCSLYIVFRSDGLGRKHHTFVSWCVFKFSKSTYTNEISYSVFCCHDYSVAMATLLPRTIALSILFLQLMTFQTMDSAIRGSIFLNFLLYWIRFLLRNKKLLNSEYVRD